MARQKEVHFFDNETLFDSNGECEADAYSQYHSFFQHDERHKAVGESTPIYMYWPNTQKRIYQYNKDIKIIILLRNPITRAFSHWNMECLRKKEHRTFTHAIHAELQGKNIGDHTMLRHFSYCDRGFYSKQIDRLWSFFPRQQILILKSEWLWTSSQETFQKICEFLDISPIAKLTLTRQHSLPYERGMTKREQFLLKEIFKSEIRTLEQKLGWDCADWLTD